MPILPQDRLRRWGYRRYRQQQRQRSGLLRCRFETKQTRGQRAGYFHQAMREDRFRRTPRGLTAAKKRSVRRCPFVASAEVTEVSTGTTLAARTSELGI